MLGICFILPTAYNIHTFHSYRQALASNTRTKMPFSRPSLSGDSSDLPPPYTPSSPRTSSSQPAPAYKATAGQDEHTIPASSHAQYTSQAPMRADSELPLIFRITPDDTTHSKQCMDEDVSFPYRY